MSRYTQLIAAILMTCLWPSGTTLAKEIGGQDILESLQKESCNERKNIKRVRCMEDALDTIANHLGTERFSSCIPQHGKAPRAERKPFKQAMKMWFPSKKTSEFIRPDLPWNSPEKPLGVSNLEECITQAILSKKRDVIDSNGPVSCQTKNKKLLIPEDIQNMGKASGRLLSVLAASTGREADVYYSYEWKAQDKSVSCRPQALTKGTGQAWECENARKHRDTPRLKQNSVIIRIPDSAATEKMDALLTKANVSLKNLKKAQEECQTEVEKSIGHLTDLNLLLGEPSPESDLAVFNAEIVKKKKSWLNAKHFSKHLKQLEQQINLLKQARKNADRIQKADLSRQKKVATDLARICYGQSIGIWGLTVKYGSELDYRMSRKSRAMGPKTRHLKRMRHACKQTKAALNDIGGNVHLRRMPGDLIPEKLTNAELNRRVKELTRTIQAAGIKEESNICFGELQKPIAKNRQAIQDQLDSCEAVMSYFEKSGKKTLPHNKKTRADAQQQLMKTGRIAHNISRQDHANAADQECLRMWSNMIYKYNSVSKVNWMQCCKRQIPKSGLKNNKIKGQLLRRCAR